MLATSRFEGVPRSLNGNQKFMVICGGVRTNREAGELRLAPFPRRLATQIAHQRARVTQAVEGISRCTNIQPHKPARDFPERLPSIKRLKPEAQ